MMDKQKYYSTGEFARKGHVSLRTIRWYDRMNLLKPACRSDDGRRYYTEADLAKLQQILLFKYLGFSLDEIREMTIASADPKLLVESMRIQRKLVEERIEEMKEVSSALSETITALSSDQPIDYSNMLDAMHVTSMDNALKAQYEDDANISARIRLHNDYSINPEGWYPWLFRQMELKNGMKVLEVGCGIGTLWQKNRDRIPEDISILLSDKSEGMLRDAARLTKNDARFTVKQFDCALIPYADHTFDAVIANHVLFYCDDLDAALKEIRRVLKTDGKLFASTYSREHMKEIRQLVQDFNPQIRLSEEPLYEVFGLANGEKKLKPFFSSVELRRYEDAIETEDAGCLISYILSCHGNQNHLLVDHFREFKDYVTSRIQDGFHITKDAGLFICDV